MAMEIHLDCTGGVFLRIALVADIHSNNIAFTAVLNHIKMNKIDGVLFLGDYVFGGSGSKETIDLLLEYTVHPYAAISGNKEDYIEPIEQQADWVVPVLHDMYNQLTLKDLEFLKSLPNELTIEVQGVSVRICHIPHPERNKRIFNVVDKLKREKNTPNWDVLKDITEHMKEDICIFGHYHLFMDETINNKRFICPSSVGLPMNGDRRAQYMILSIEGEKILTEKQFISYNHMELVADFERKGYLERHREWSMNTLLSMLTARNYIGTSTDVGYGT